MFEATEGPADSGDTQHETRLPLPALLRFVPLPQAAAASPVCEVLDHLESATPDDQVVTTLRELDPARLSDGDRVRVLALWDRCASWVASQQQQWLVAVAGPVREERDWPVEEVGAALRLSGAAAAKRILVARALHRRFPDTAAALANGDITWLHANVLATQTRDLDDDTARDVEARVLPTAPQQTVGAFETTVKTAVIAADAILAAKRAARARRDKSLRYRPLPDGRASLELLAPADDVTRLMGQLDASARRTRAAHPDDPRDHETLQADALLSLADAALPDPDLTRAPRRMTAGIVVDLPTALALADNPAHLDGYGPIDASTARELLTDADWRLMMIDATTGHLIHLGTRSYRPSRRLAEFITARDRTCRFPYCTRPAQHCDIDHRDPYDHDNPDAGGATDDRNCWALCERHHPCKHEAGWTPRVIDDHHIEWTSPAGRTYTLGPPDLRPMRSQPESRPTRARPDYDYNADPPF